MKKYLLLLVFVSLSVLSYGQKLKRVRDENTNKWGFVNVFTDNWAIKADYAAVNRFVNKIASVQTANLWGAIDSTGKILVPMMYETALEFNGDFSRIKKGGKYGLINKQGKEITPCTYENAAVFNNGMMSVQKGKSWGAIDSTGKEIVPFLYDSSFVFHDDMAIVRIGYKRGYVNKSGQVAITLESFENLNPFGEGVAAVKKDGAWFFINKDASIAFKPKMKVDEIYGAFHNGLICVYAPIDNYVAPSGLKYSIPVEKHIFINKKGKRVMKKAAFDSPAVFQGNRAWVMKEDLPFLLAPNSDFYHLPEFFYAGKYKYRIENISEVNDGLAFFNVGETEYVTDTVGNVIMSDAGKVKVVEDFILSEKTKFDISGNYPLVSSDCSNTLPSFTLKVTLISLENKKVLIEGFGDNGYGDKQFEVNLGDKVDYGGGNVIYAKESKKKSEYDGGPSKNQWGLPFFIGKEKFYLQDLAFFKGEATVDIYYEVEGDYTADAKAYKFKSLTCKFRGKK